VYTVGSTNDPRAPPALSCQARPQEAEVFGEFPPRKSLDTYTKYPVVVPSSTPAYDSSFKVEYLQSLTSADVESADGELNYARSAIDAAQDGAIRGYCVEILNYISNATETNPKRGFGTDRTAVWGLQRPPLLDGGLTSIRCDNNVSYDDMLPVFLPFYVTNARNQVEISVDPNNQGLLSALKGLQADKDVLIKIEDSDAHANRMKDEANRYYNVVPISPGGLTDFPMVGQFISLYFPLGHIKSTMSGDEEFCTLQEECQVAQGFQRVAAQQKTGCVTLMIPAELV